jgi:hypothetical protein
MHDKSMQIKIKTSAVFFIDCNGLILWENFSGVKF